MTDTLRPLLERLGLIAIAFISCVGAGRAMGAAEPNPPFANLTPARIVRLTPGQPVEEALREATPGTAFVFEDGDYGPIKLPRQLEGTAEKPIWLISRRLHGATADYIEGGATKNVVIEGFHVTSRQARNGILIAANVGGKGQPMVWGDPARLTGGIVIRNVLVDAPNMDAIKMTGGDNLWILDSDLTGGQRGQGIDVDASRQVYILRNRATTVGRFAAIMVKFGTVGALIEGNECWSAPGGDNDGIHIGERSGPMAPPPHARDANGRLAFEAKDVTSRGNHCVVGGRPLVFAGAVPPCQSIGDYLDSTSFYMRLIVGASSKSADQDQGGRPGPGHAEIPTRGCEVIDPVVKSTANLLKSPDPEAVKVTRARVSPETPRGAFGPAPYVAPAWLAGA
jgi:hypothetical protein